eukprot:COSAG01_NODE_21402_length_904_cov_0.514286_2_plen_115_part_00
MCSRQGPRLGSGTDIEPGKADNDQEDTKELQRLLGQKDDGIAGPLTGAAIKRFQAMSGLLEDGVVGPKTRALLAVQGLVKDGASIPAGYTFPLIPTALCPYMSLVGMRSVGLDV